MSSFRQKIVNLFQNGTKKIIPYALSLAAAVKDHSYAGIARAIELNYDKIYQGIKLIDPSIEWMLNRQVSIVGRHQTTANRGVIIVDFTRLEKSKDAQTPLTTWDRDGRRNGTNNGYSTAFCVWTNGKITIPLTFCFWENRLSSNEDYVSKKQLTQDLILAVVAKLGYLETIVDGEFSNYDMLKFFAENRLDFTAHIARNRKVSSLEGESTQLQQHHALRLVKNQKSRTMAAYLAGRIYDFTAVRQKTRNGKSKIVYIISSSTRLAKEHVKIYALRWEIEKFFRTTKQSLGLEDCQTQKLSGIVARIVAVNLMYTALEEVKILKKLSSPEGVLRVLRSKNDLDLNHEYTDLIETFLCF